MYILPTKLLKTLLQQLMLHFLCTINGNQELIIESNELDRQSYKISTSLEEETKTCDYGIIFINIYKNLYG